ncbi:hypothetical protein BDD12DRAFT_809796 [Trichophaea hybrida]|nr:hypothetical protein BDD12DRAFT_809796 [Trichophaea hybrida]
MCFWTKLCDQNTEHCDLNGLLKDQGKYKVSLSDYLHVNEAKQRTLAIDGERGWKAYLLYMKRLVGSKDVVFSGRDLLPSLMQPFLLTSYYEICRERGLSLPDMFQWDLVWEPKTSLGATSTEERKDSGIRASSNEAS